ncbi:MAG: hypothetical protein HY556_09395 [Euryarchaeota archaeon]|nr:hypothetical protein [Euryarchaeota archaeon]
MPTKTKEKAKNLRNAKTRKTATDPFDPETRSVVDRVMKRHEKLSRELAKY